MDRCQICQEPIWGDKWPASKDKVMRKFVCFYCFTKMRDGGYKPTSMKKSNLVVCDRCGEVVGNVKQTDNGWVCEDCEE